MVEEIQTLSVRIDTDTARLEKALARLEVDSKRLGDRLSRVFSDASLSMDRLDAKLSRLDRRTRAAAFGLNLRRVSTTSSGPSADSARPLVEPIDAEQLKREVERLVPILKEREKEEDTGRRRLRDAALGAAFARIAEFLAKRATRGRARGKPPSLRKADRRATEATGGIVGLLVGELAHFLDRSLSERLEAEKEFVEFLQGRREEVRSRLGESLAALSLAIRSSLERDEDRIRQLERDIRIQRDQLSQLDEAIGFALRRLIRTLETVPVEARRSVQGSGGSSVIDGPGLQTEVPRLRPASQVPLIERLRPLDRTLGETMASLALARRELPLFREDMRGASDEALLLEGTLRDIDDTTGELRDEFGALFDGLGRGIGATGGLATGVLGDVSEATRGLAGVVDGVLNESLARTVQRWQEIGAAGLQALEAILLKIFEVQAAAAAAETPGGGGGLGGILDGVFGAIGGAFGLFGGGGGPVAAVSPGSGSIFGGAGGFKFSSLPGLQGGGPVVPDRPVMVGERGREILVPTAPGRVIDNLETERMLGQGAAPVAQFNIYQNFELCGRLTQHEAFMMEGQMRRIGRESNMELVREVQRGGGMAQIFGRRPMR